MRQQLKESSPKYKLRKITNKQERKGGKKRKKEGE